MTSSPVRFAAARWRRVVNGHNLKKLASLGALATALLAKEIAKLRRRDSLDRHRHTTEEEIRGALNAYLSGRWSLDDLSAWLIGRTWDNDQTPELARRVELLIAENDLGHRDDLAADLRALAATPSRASSAQWVRPG